MSIETTDRVAQVFRRAYQLVVDETDFVADVDLVTPPAKLVPQLAWRWWNRPAAVVGGVVVAVLIAVGLAATVLGAGESDLAGGPIAPRYPLLEDVETILGPGAELTFSSESLISGSEGPTRMVAWAQKNATGLDLAIVLLEGPPGSDLAFGYAGLEGDQVTVTASTGTVFTLTAPTELTAAGVGWSDASMDRDFLLLGVGVGTDPLFVAAEDFASGGAVPEKWGGVFERVYEGDPILGLPDDVEVRELTYQSADGRLQIDVMSIDGWPQAELAALLRSASARVVALGAGNAVVVPWAEDRVALIWTGSDGVAVSLSGLGLSEDEIIEAAGRLTESQPDLWAAASGRAFELGYDRVGDLDALFAGDDWEFVAQEVTDANGSGICSWAVIGGDARRASIQCEFPDGSNSAQFGNVARIAAGTLFVGSASNSITDVELTLDDGRVLVAGTTRFPGSAEPSYFAFVVPRGLRADTISLRDASGVEVFTTPVDNG